MRTWRGQRGKSERKIRVYIESGIGCEDMERVKRKNWKRDKSKNSVVTERRKGGSIGLDKCYHNFYERSGVWHEIERSTLEQQRGREKNTIYKSERKE